MTDSIDIVTAPESEETPAVAAIGSRTTHEFIRYFVASLLALVVDVGILAFLTSYVGIGYLISAAISFMLGLAVVYIASITWVFEARSMRNPAAEFSIFLFVGIVGLGLNEIVLWVLTSGLGVYYLLSKVASVALVFLWNFFTRKYLLFTRHQSTPHND